MVSYSHIDGFLVIFVKLEKEIIKNNYIHASLYAKREVLSPHFAQ